ncbi:MAG: trimeric intracellular cation channel family protein [Firmicutes bacterium]|nr:trimeric intracellular cation channel family protein [Bacillota bacterium]
MEQFILVLELIGTCAFAISGAVVSIKKHLDIFGVVFCGLITALGGGVIRDILLSNLPPAMFCNYIYAFFAVGTTILTFLFALIAKNSFESKAIYIDRVNNIFDAIGLGVFTIVGINTALSMGFTDNPFFVIFLGMTTGCGGGILRDVLVREVPFILSEKIYAIASILGGILYYQMVAVWQVDVFLSVICGIAFIVVLRITSSVFRWDLPKAY